MRPPLSHHNNKQIERNAKASSKVLLTHSDSRIKGLLEEFEIAAGTWSTFGELRKEFRLLLEGIPGVLGGVLEGHAERHYGYFRCLVSAHSACVTKATGK